jgi:hypothetical protein
MLIVPSGELLHLEARVTTTDYDLVALGQPANIRLHAFNQRTTPELSGVVSRVAPDITREPQTGLTYYVVRVTIPQTEIDRIAPLQINAGMQADVYLKTYDRTPVSYLIKPVNPNQILLTLKKIIDNKRLVREKTAMDYQQDFRQIFMQMTSGLEHEGWVETRPPASEVW